MLYMVVFFMALLAIYLVYFSFNDREEISNRTFAFVSGLVIFALTCQLFNYTVNETKHEIYGIYRGYF